MSDCDLSPPLKLVPQTSDDVVSGGGREGEGDCGLRPAVDGRMDGFIGLRRRRERRIRGRKPEMAPPSSTSAAESNRGSDRALSQTECETAFRADDVSKLN